MTTLPKCDKCRNPRADARYAVALCARHARGVTMLAGADDEEAISFHRRRRGGW